MKMSRLLMVLSVCESLSLQAVATDGAFQAFVSIGDEGTTRVERYSVDKSGNWTYVDRLTQEGDGRSGKIMSVEYYQGLVYVTSSERDAPGVGSKINVFTPEGEFLKEAATNILLTANDKATILDCIRISPDGHYAYVSAAFNATWLNRFENNQTTANSNKNWCKPNGTCRGMAIDRSGKVYVANRGKGGVYVYDPAVNTEPHAIYPCKTQIEGAPEPHAVALDEDKGYLYVTDKTKTWAVYKIGVTTAPLASGIFPATMNALEMRCVDGIVYAACYGAKSICRYDFDVPNSKATYTTLVSFSEPVTGIALAPAITKRTNKLGEVYLTNTTFGRVERFGVDVDGKWTFMNVVAKMNDGFLPAGTMASSCVRDGLVYVAGYDANKLTQIHSYTPDGTHVKTHATGISSTADHLAISPDSAFVYISNCFAPNANRVLRYSLLDGTGNAYITDGVGQPRSLDVDSEGNLYVAARSANAVKKFATGETPKLLGWQTFANASGIAWCKANRRVFASDKQEIVKIFDGDLGSELFSEQDATKYGNVLGFACIGTAAYCVSYEYRPIQALKPDGTSWSTTSLFYLPYVVLTASAAETVPKGLSVIVR